MNLFNRWNREKTQGSLFAAFFGLLIIIGSVFMLWFNEGRINFGKVAENSEYINGSLITSNSEAKFVALEGDLTSTENLGDPLFVESGKFISLSRSVEMYAWEEKTETDDDTDETFYNYDTTWTSGPQDSSQFEYIADHENPAMPFSSAEYIVSTANVGAYSVDPRTVNFPPSINLDINQITFNSETVADLNNYAKTGYTIEGEYLYIGYGTLGNPSIGDLRVEFSAIPHTSQVTIFGDISGDRVIPHTIKDADILYRVFFAGREAAIAEMHEEYTFALWGTRIGGSAMMWVGMIMLISPITTIIDMLLSFLPFLRNASRFVISLILLPFALIISLSVILISFVAHNPLVLGIILGLILFGVASVIIISRRNEEQTIA